MLKRIVAIDPGANGAIVSQTGEDFVQSWKMPKTPDGLFDLLFDALDVRFVHVYCENVGGYRPGNSGPSACKFSRHVGHIDMALVALAAPRTYVVPSKWMKVFLDGKVPKDKKDRKNAIKARAQELYPHLKVTLANADALGLLTYALSVAS